MFNFICIFYFFFIFFLFLDLIHLRYCELILFRYIDSVADNIPEMPKTDTSWSQSPRHLLFSSSSAHIALQVDIKQKGDWVMHAILMKISGVQATVFSCHTAYQQERGEKRQKGNGGRQHNALFRIVRKQKGPGQQ